VSGAFHQLEIADVTGTGHISGTMSERERQNSNDKCGDFDYDETAWLTCRQLMIMTMMNE